MSLLFCDWKLLVFTAQRIRSDAGNRNCEGGCIENLHNCYNRVFFLNSAYFQISKFSWMSCYPINYQNVDLITVDDFICDGCIHDRKKNDSDNKNKNKKNLIQK